MDEVWFPGWPRYGPVEGMGEAISRRCRQVLAGGDGLLDQCRGHTRLPSKVGGAAPVVEGCGMWKSCQRFSEGTSFDHAALC